MTRNSTNQLNHECRKPSFPKSYVNWYSILMFSLKVVQFNLGTLDKTSSANDYCHCVKACCTIQVLVSDMSPYILWYHQNCFLSLHGI